MENKELKPTSLDELCKYVEGRIVQLPSFGDNQPFYAKLKRPALLSLIKNGKIPNSLLVTASSLFAGKFDIPTEDNDESSQTLTNLFKVLDVVCEASFVEPTYRELKENGIELTDEQYMAVFNYTQKGVKALEPFRG